MEVDLENGYILQLLHPQDLKSEDVAAIAALYQHCFGSKCNAGGFVDVISAGNLKPYYWKIRETPNGKQNYIGLIKFENQIIAHAAYICHSATLRGQAILAMQGVDAMVHSKHRRKSLYQKIGKHVRELATQDGVAVCYGFPNKENPQSNEKNKTKFDIKELMSVPFFENRHIIPLSKGANVLQEMTEIPKEVEDIWNVMTSNVDLAIVRNKEFLHWRYLDNIVNASKYTFLGLNKLGSGMEGLVVVKKFQPGGGGKPKGHIVDLVSPDEATTQILVQGAERFLSNSGISTNSMFLYPALLGASELSKSYTKEIDAFTLVVSDLKNSVGQNLKCLLHPGDNDVF